MTALFHSHLFLVFITILQVVLTSLCGGPGLSLGLVMWDLWWTKWRWGFPEVLWFPRQSSFHQFLLNHHHLGLVE
jgi:hypothetical protein